MQQCGACYKWMDGWLVSLGRGRYSLNYPMSYPIDHLTVLTMIVWWLACLPPYHCIVSALLPNVVFDCFEAVAFRHWVSTCSLGEITTEPWGQHHQSVNFARPVDSVVPWRPVAWCCHAWDTRDTWCRNQLMLLWMPAWCSLLMVTRCDVCVPSRYGP